MYKFPITLLIVLFSCGSIFCLNAQETKTKLTKAEKKKIKEEAALKEWNETKAFVLNQRFVFTADQFFTNGGSGTLDPKINFFYVDGDLGINQFGFEGLILGGNGAGGWTTTGVVTKYEVVAENPKKPIQVYVFFKGNAGQGGWGMGTFFITIYNDRYAELNFSTSGVRLKGSINTPEKANFYIANTN